MTKKTKPNTKLIESEKSHSLLEAIEMIKRPGLHIICSTNDLTHRQIVVRLEEFLKIVKEQGSNFDFRQFNASMISK